MARPDLERVWLLRHGRMTSFFIPAAVEARLNLLKVRADDGPDSLCGPSPGPSMP
jgi:hypothetical protein